MSGHKKNIFSTLKELLGGKISTGYAENDDKKKKLIQEAMKETASSSFADEVDKAALLKLMSMMESQFNEKSSALEEAVSKQKQSELEASDKAALMKTLSMLETQLDRKNLALEEAVSKQRSAELEVLKLRQANEQKKNENEKKLSLIKQLINIDQDGNDTKGDLKQKDEEDESNKYGQGNSERGGRKKRQKSKQRNKNKSENKTNMSGNLNFVEQNKMKQFENKKFDEENLLKSNNVKIFNPVKDNQPSSNYNELLKQSNHPNNLLQGLPMKNFNSMNNSSFPNYQYAMQPNQNIYPQQMNHNMFGQQPNPNTHISAQPQQFGPYNNFTQPGQNMGFNIPNINVPPPLFNSSELPTAPSQYRANNQFRDVRGRRGVDRGRGNIRGNTRGGFNRRNQSGENNSSPNTRNKDDGEFVFVSKKDLGRNNYSNRNQMNDGHFQNVQKTNFKKKRNRPAREQKKDEKEDDTDSVLNGMMDVFSKMFGNISAQLTTPKTEETLPSKPSGNTSPNHQTGAIRKNVSNNQNRMEGNKQMKDNKKKNNPLKLFVGSGFPSEEEAAAKKINLNQEVKDIIMIAKCEGKSITKQPHTLRDMTDFKKKYPNASAIVIKDEH